MTHQVPTLFDKAAVRRNRARAAAGYDAFAFLKDEAALRLADRVELMRRSFPVCLDLGAHDGRLARHLSPLQKIGTMIAAEPAAAFMPVAGQPSVVHDLDMMPYKDASFDAVFSCLSLHWVDDLPGLMMQIRRVLNRTGCALSI